MRNFHPVPRAAPTGTPSIPEIALAQDGVFTRTQARAAGWSDDRQRTLLRSGTWRRIAGPVLCHNELEIGPWQRARAVSLTAGLVVSHETAGALWGLHVGESLDGIGHVQRLTSPVVPHRLPLQDCERTTVAALHVTSPLRTITDLLCSLAQEAAVSMATDALQRGLLIPADLTRAAAKAHGRTGAPRARDLAMSCRCDPHSYLEWRFHGLISTLGAGWRFNVDLRDGAGFIGRVDAIHEDSMTVVELDGRRFHGPDAFQSDRTRDQRLVAMGYVVLRFTWEDVERRPLEVVARIQTTLRVRAAAHRRAA
ncbi:MAG: type IV toxin-antitoxin system AbiEi family antitoxin domain-containing protein [Candidatus Nanopelagicales bacterium]